MGELPGALVRYRRFQAALDGGATLDAAVAASRDEPGTAAPAGPRAAKPRKPAKPKGSPIWPHPNGQWCKAFGKVQKYFGSWDDHAGALRRYYQYEAARRRGEDPDLLKAQGFDEAPGDALAPAPWTWS